MHSIQRQKRRGAVCFLWSVAAKCAVIWKEDKLFSAWRDRNGTPIIINFVVKVIQGCALLGYDFRVNAMVCVAVLHGLLSEIRLSVSSHAAVRTRLQTSKVHIRRRQSHGMGIPVTLREWNHHKWDYLCFCWDFVWKKAKLKYLHGVILPLCFLTGLAFSQIFK